MIPFFDYFNAKRRLKLANETIQMMGGENDCQPMLLGQRDYLELEVDYFREQSKKFTIFLLTLAVFCVSLYYLYVNGVFNV